MTEEQYLHQRLEDQIQWYEKKSRKNKRFYLMLRSIELICAATLPFMIRIFSRDNVSFKTAIEVQSLILIFATALLSMFRFQRLWVEYRTIAESLKHEKYLFQFQAKPYDREDRFAILVDRVEHTMSEKLSYWQKLSAKNRT